MLHLLCAIISDPSAVLEDLSNREETDQSKTSSPSRETKGQGEGSR